MPSNWRLEQNTLWKIPLPDEAGSTPIIVGDRVFITSTDREKSLLHASCLSALDGTQLWEHTLPYPFSVINPYGTLASPSPVADQERVIFMFGAGEMLACDLEGNILWQRNLAKDFGPLTIEFFYAASPLLFRERLYLAVLRDDVNRHLELYPDAKGPLDSFLLCIDPATGKDIFKRDRPSTAEGIESRDSYATPVPVEDGEKSRIFLIGAHFLTGHDWQTGEETLRVNYHTGVNHRQRCVPTPVVAGDYLLAIRPRYGALFAIAKNTTGQHDSSVFAWEHKPNTPDTPSPIYYRGRVYMIHDSRGIMTCLDPETGKEIWTGNLDGSALFHASPTAADGRIYCIDRAGQVSVVEAGDTFKVLNRVLLEEEPCSSSIAIARGCLFIRTRQNLYCFGIPK